MSDILPPASLISHYRIVSKLGAGGMGEVYLAQDVELERQVALKVLLAEVASDEDRVRRFVQEAKAASALNHPNILTVYEIGALENSRFIATELIKGQTLHDRLRHEPLVLREALDVAMQVAAALSAAHGAGIVHRDIKPDNIMLRDDGLVKVLDFGLAKLTTTEETIAGPETAEEAQTRMRRQTRPGVVMGTVSYMSPEQARGKEIDARSDIWSLGVVLYEMLTGRTPFAGETMNDSIAAILTKEPEPLDVNTPAELQRIIRKALQKKPDERYQTVRDFQLDLKNLKRDLEFSEELERSQVPHSTRSANVSINQISDNATASQSLTPSTQSSLSPPQRSSAEYLVSEIKNHKRGAALVLAVLLAALIGGGYWFWNSRTTASNEINSIAVMPFVNESGNQDVEYLSDGMTETLIKSLSDLQNLDVKPRSAVFRYKGKDTDLQSIGRDLDVQAILNGRVVQRGDQMTLSLELVDVQRNRVIWTEQYQRKASELVSLQSQIAKDVSTRLTPKFSGAEETKVTRTATSDPEAYQAFLKGRYYWNRRTAENLKKAIEQFKIATDRDPNYALAFVGLADCYTVLSEYAGSPTSETIPQAKAYAERAIALDPQIAEPHATLGSVNRQLWQWAEAEKEHKRAIEINPNYPTVYHWYSILLKELGRNDEAAVAISRAHELDPLSSVISVNLAELYQLQNNHDASVETCLKLIELDPNYAGAYESLGVSYVIKGKNIEAIAAVDKAAELSKRAGVTLGALGYVYAAAGKRTEAVAVIKELEDKYAKKEAIGLDVASVYAGLGEKDKAFEWLEKDFQTRNGKLASSRWWVAFESLWSDPRFKDLLKRMNLPE